MVTLLIPCFIGTGELLLIGGLALLLFGGKKLPEMMRGLGQGVKQFKEGMKYVETTINEDAEAERTATRASQQAPTSQSEKAKDEKQAQ